ncbi:MAG: hypothetical protein SAK29_10070 [Scytonema sp. PMC 1069.18]|nr:hypothetical protein [Scytonema sp. PMC 1069.18]MEC4883002.1 hypothetical protein [Scytonema sp. PMC 1070.18]
MAKKTNTFLIVAAIAVGGYSLAPPAFADDANVASSTVFTLSDGKVTGLVTTTAAGTNSSAASAINGFTGNSASAMGSNMSSLSITEVTKVTETTIPVGDTLTTPNEASLISDQP